MRHALVTALLAPMFISGCSTPEEQPLNHQQAYEVSHESRRIVTVPKLVVNTSLEYRTQINKSEAEGIQDLRELVKMASVEEAWAFFPQKSTWLEIGYDETGEGADVDHKSLVGYFQRGDSITYYHIHPRASRRTEGDEKVIQETQMYLEQNLARVSAHAAELILTTLSDVTAAIPSPEDAYIMMQFKGFFPRTRFRICSEFGIMEYATSIPFYDVGDKRIPRFVQNYKSRISALEQAKFDRIGIDLLKGNLIDPREYVTDLASHLSSTAIDLKFIPFPDIKPIDWRDNHARTW